MFGGSDTGATTFLERTLCYIDQKNSITLTVEAEAAYTKRVQLDAIFSTGNMIIYVFKCIISKVQCAQY